MRVLTISGSLRPESLNTLLLRAAEEQAPAGVQLVRFAELAAIPPFHGERSDPGESPAAVRELREQIEAADAVLIATPEYNGSIPGVLKNALDWVSTPFPDNVLRGKPVAVIGASTGGYGGMWAQAELRKVLGLTGARVVNGDLSLARAHEHFDDAGTLAAPHDERLTRVLDTLLAEVQPLAA
ncbi:MAG TPA: NAD(P)H-dependent oxidoreductase [Gaiellales bacterium]|jgi:chromate reductase|nr:NAD(P)H-dependent oxidoreductase [Gaiellales bacterium]